MIQEGLLRAFAALDVNECRSMLDEAFNDYPVETLCVRLFLPLLQRVAEQVVARQMSEGSERFGYVMIRNRLATVLSTMGVPGEAPLALLACAPGEIHEMDCLMLTVLWRRVNLRAVYVGVGLTEEGLMAEARARRPPVIYVSAATEVGARAIGHVAGALARLDEPRPMLVFGGGAFVRSPQLQGRIRGGYFAGQDVVTATRHVLQLLADGPLKPQ